jgi:hypothetical protein
MKVSNTGPKIPNLTSALSLQRRKNICGSSVEMASDLNFSVHIYNTVAADNKLIG